MKPVKLEIDRIRRVLRGEMLREDLLAREKVRKERKRENEKQESVRKKRECENFIWEVIEKSISDSERESRKKRARGLQVMIKNREAEKHSSEREKLVRKEKDRNDLRESSQNILQKRKRNGKRKYTIRGVVRVREMRQAGEVTPQPESESKSETGGVGGEYTMTQ